MALVPILTLIGGSAGALLTFKVQGRTAGAAVISAEAAHETAAVAGRNAAVQEMAELRQYWTAIVANVNADNATVRAENATLRSDIAALNAMHKTDMAEVKEALAECHATNHALMERIHVVIAEQAHTSERVGHLERGQNGA